MAYFEDYMAESKGKKMKSGMEDDYASPSGGASEFKTYSENNPQAIAPSSGGGGGVDKASVAAAGASGAAVAGPWGAAIAAGGAFLSQYLGQKAADERAKRDRSVQIQQQYAQNQNQGLDTMMQAARGALR